MINNFLSKYGQIIRYLFAGGIATLSNLLVLFVCVNYFKFWYLSSTIISFCIAVIISYSLQKFFVFKDNGKENINKQFLHFFTYQFVMLGVNTLLMYLFVDIINIWYLLAQVISALIIAFANYIYFNKIIFKK